MESFDFPAGGGVVGSAVLVDYPVVLEGAFEPVPASFPSREAGGVNHPVVGQDRGGKPHGCCDI